MTSCSNIRGPWTFNLRSCLTPVVGMTNVIGLSIYGILLLIFNSNLWPNSARLQDVRLRNLRDLEFDLSRSLKVKCGSVIELYAYML